MNKPPLIEIRESVTEVGSANRKLRTFLPVFTPDCCACGTLQFALWQMWEDEPETHEPARQACRENAVKVMRSFTAKL